MNDATWEDVECLDCPDEAYNIFLNKFQLIYDQAFPATKIKLKTKTLLSPWITKGLLKSSKTKHKLYDEYLKNKSYKNLFESLKRKSKKLHYSKLIIKYKNNI